MKIKRLFFLIISMLIYTGILFAQGEDTLTLITYYPAPYGEHNDLRANFYRDLEDTPADGIDDPNTYFMDLDNRSRLNKLAVGVDPSLRLGIRTLYISGIADDRPMDRASSYAKMENVSGDYIFSSVYGEAYNVTPTTVNGRLIGIYGKCTGTSSDNRGVFGRAGDSTETDYGVYGKGDEYGVRARGDICGAYAYFGGTIIPQPGGICAYARDAIRTGDVGHGVFGRTSSAPYTNPSTDVTSFYYGGSFFGPQRGVYAYSEDAPGVYGETNDNDHFGAVFTGYRGLLDNTGGGIAISVPQGDNRPEERPEIVNGDRTITMRTTARDTTSYGRVTVVSQALNKDSLAGVAAKQNRDHFFYPYIYLKSKRIAGGSDAPYKHIVSSRDMELKPGMDDAAEKKIYIEGSVYVGNAGAPVHDYYSDLAEVFELKDKQDLEYGDVVVIDEEGLRLKKSSYAYDDKVAGVISSELHASMVIGTRDDGTQDRPLAIAGQVLCKVDAGYGEIKTGDFLVTSPTQGYAMRAEPIMEKDGHKVYGQGVILGKALEPLKEGKGKILILVSLM